MVSFSRLRFFSSPSSHVFSPIDPRDGERVISSAIPINNLIPQYKERGGPATCVISLTLVNLPAEGDR
ncbi:hypothetical protein JTE90_003141 [Oedothorax gibbosus]|uniref:Uncharacterized protein n=1 Tax=Oedothorax gibbosus TaxID=931172 RepID=A0AAV6VF58_9ARAC|nr:hypothetical protein JTE90_003141 [Oedothorax gibbosus]